VSSECIIEGDAITVINPNFLEERFAVSQLDEIVDSYCLARLKESKSTVNGLSRV
jgi:hypothetical protein